MSQPSLVSVIVVSFNTRELLRECLGSVGRHLTGTPHEVLVVDNASTDGSVEMIQAEFPGARLLVNSENQGFGRANNRAMAEAQGDLFLLLNSDAKLVDRSLAGLFAQIRSVPDIGVIGPRLVRPDGTLQASAYRFGWLRLIALEELGLYKLWPRAGRAELLLGGYCDHAAPREADWLVGACLVVRRQVFEQVGGFDPAIFLYGEEEEWCWRMRNAGWRILYSPLAQVVHVGHASAVKSLGEERRLRLCLAAADALVLRREGRLAAALLPTVRVVGALQKAAVFGLLGLLRPGDARVRQVLWTSRVVLGRYLARPGEEG